MRDLFPHQRQALAYAERRQRIALFMEMRLGKSLVTIRWARHHQLDRILVIGPSSVLPGWTDELLEEDVRFSDIHLLLDESTTARLAIAREVDTGWVLINYEAIRHIPQILALPWSGIVLDESTKVRNPKAQTTKLLLRHTPHILHRAILSGLPAPESPLDYFCQMLFLQGSFLDHYNYWSFRHKFFIPDVRGWEWAPKSTTTAVIKQEVHKQAFVLTRKAAGLGERKMYERRVVAMTPLQQKSYQTVMKEFRFEKLETQWATTRLLWAARIAGGFSPDQANPKLISDTKIQEVQELLTGELAQDMVVIWFRFNEELAAVVQRIQSLNIPVGCITGETPVTERKQIVNEFQRQHLRVLCMQLKCGKFGLNTSTASTAIYYSNSYDFEDRAQSEDRIVHPQKHEPLLYMDLVTRGTVDAAVVRVLQNKSVTSRTFMTRLLEEMKRDHERSMRVFQ